MKYRNEYIKLLFDLYAEINEQETSDNLDAFKKAFRPSEISGFNIITGYVSQLLDFSSRLDLTYRTLPSLQEVLNDFHHQQARRYLPKKNKEITTKTAAAYLMMLAINMHGMRLSVTTDQQGPWASRYQITTGLNAVDLLPYVTKALSFQEEFSISFDLLDAPYADMTSVSLKALIPS